MKLRKWGAAMGAVMLLSASVMANDVSEEARTEAKTRVSPVIADIQISDNNVPTAGFIAGQTYTLTWTMIGYDPEYQYTALVLFDCTDSDNANYECGATFSDDNKIVVKIRDVHVDEETQDWNYRASTGEYVYADKHTYSAEFTMPETRQWVDSNEENTTNKGPWPTCGEGASLVVARFYQKAEGVASNAPSIAALIGARAENSYGVYSRRVATTICAQQ
jgi:hypothetical protein